MKTTLLTLLIVLLNFFHISAQNAPVAVNDTFYVDFNDTISYNHISGNFNSGILNFLVNDYDVDNDNIIIDTAFYYGLGTFSINTHSPNNNGLFFSDIYYLPQTNFYGTDSITYVIKDTGNPVRYDTAWVYLKIKRKEIEYLDLNNIKAGLSLSGLFQDLINSEAAFEVPKGSELNTIYAANLWVGGKYQDSAYASCETYALSQQNNNYTNFYSRAGPMMDSAYYPDGYSYEWDRLWKIHSWEIDYHINNWSNVNYQAIEVIENWPAHGDTTKGQAFYLAPFVDVNNDGIYNPYTGDYPKIKGQQAIYNIYNDVRHLPGSASQMNIEVHYMAYAYKCPADSAINNTIFVDYMVYNRSSLTYDSTYIGMWVDLDIGGTTDDYVGCDVERSTFYGYNSSDSSAVSYKYHQPAQGVTFLKGAKQDVDGLANNYGINANESINGLGFGDAIVDNEYWGMEHFSYYSIGGGQFLGDGDPQNKKDHYNYLTGVWRDNSQFVWGGNGNAASSGGTVPTKYLFPGTSDPLWYSTGGVSTTPVNWSEKLEGNPGGDRRGLGSTGPFTFEPDSSVEITLAFVFGRDYQNTGAQAGVVVMQERVDSIRSYYLNDFTNTACGLALSVNESKQTTNVIKIYPNPFNNIFIIDYELQNERAQLNVYNVFGKLVKEQKITTKQTQIDLTNQANGVYFITLIDGNNALTKRVVKQ